MKKILILLLCLVLLSACAPTNYEVSNIHYSTSGEMLTSVCFDISQPASGVYVAMSVNGKLQRCESADPFTHWTCPLEGVVSAKVDGVRVVVKK